MERVSDRVPAILAISDASIRVRLEPTIIKFYGVPNPIAAIVIVAIDDNASHFLDWMVSNLGEASGDLSDDGPAL